jgi:hypothetical protein
MTAALYCMRRLEAFVHDPLINWRLLNTTDTADTTAIDAQLNSMQVRGSRLWPVMLRRTVSSNLPDVCITSCLHGASWPANRQGAACELHCLHQPQGICLLSMAAGLFCCHGTGGGSWMLMHCF